jgi:hypothetical protein
MPRPGVQESWDFAVRRTVVISSIAMIVLLAAVAVHAQTYLVIHNFVGGLDGSEATSGLTSDAAGNLYGTTFEGDALTGTVYKLTRKNSSWVMAPLYLFPYEGSRGSHSLCAGDRRTRRHFIRHDSIRRKSATVS